MAEQQWVRLPLKGPWDVERAADGTVRVSTRLSSRLINGALWFILALGFLWVFSEAGRQRPIPPGAPGTETRFAVESTVMVALLVASVCGLFLREEWRARPGLLEVQKELLGFRWVKRFTEGMFEMRTMHARRRGRGPELRLFVEASEGRQLVADIGARPSEWENWESTGLSQLARILSEATGFLVTDPWDEITDWGAARTAVSGSAGAVEIRHLHTGQVLRQVAGGTLVRADLADAVLEGADLQRADLRGADLSGTDLRGASLKNANLTGAKLARSLLTAADLSSADLTGASLIGATLTGATYDTRTRWPSGFDPRHLGAVLGEEEPTW